MTTAEYAVGTVAACGFGGILYKILTSPEVMQDAQGAHRAGTRHGVLTGCAARPVPRVRDRGYRRPPSWRSCCRPWCCSRCSGSGRCSPRRRSCAVSTPPASGPGHWPAGEPAARSSGSSRSSRRAVPWSARPGRATSSSSRCGRRCRCRGLGRDGPGVEVGDRAVAVDRATGSAPGRRAPVTAPRMARPRVGRAAGRLVWRSLLSCWSRPSARRWCWVRRRAGPAPGGPDRRPGGPGGRRARGCAGRPTPCAAAARVASAGRRPASTACQDLVDGSVLVVVGGPTVHCTRLGRPATCHRPGPGPGPVWPRDRGRRGSRRQVTDRAGAAAGRSVRAVRSMSSRCRARRARGSRPSSAGGRAAGGRPSVLGVTAGVAGGRHGSAVAAASAVVGRRVAGEPLLQALVLGPQLGPLLLDPGHRLALAGACLLALAPLPAGPAHRAHQQPDAEEEHQHGGETGDEHAADGGADRLSRTPRTWRTHRRRRWHRR